MTDEQIKAAAKEAFPPGENAVFYKRIGYLAGYHSRDKEVRLLRDALEQFNTLEKVSNLSDGEIVGIVNQGLNK